MYPPNLKKKDFIHLFLNIKKITQKRKEGFIRSTLSFFCHLFTKENLKHIPVRNLTGCFRQAVCGDYLVPADEEPRSQCDESGVINNFQNSDNFLTITLFHFNDLLLPKINIVYLSSSTIASFTSSNTMITELRVLVLYSS